MHKLAPYAAQDQQSLGRIYREPSPAYRGEFQRDRDRIIHCAAFRRLEYKTQVFVNHEGDMFRTRLTHSIEVAQIGRTIARVLEVNEDLTEAIALAHDLGHTPFGHAGQDALNQCMRDHGGFEHNLQSIRVVDQLEEKYAEFPGLNLTFETREGILKHCSKSNAKKLGQLGIRFLQGGQPCLEAQIANLADEIAYNSHDVDDGLRSGLISIEQLLEVELFREQYEIIINQWPTLGPRRIIHEVVRRMINAQVTDLIESSQEKISANNPNDINSVRQANETLIVVSEKMKQQHHELKRFLRRDLYCHYRVHRMTLKATGIIREIFNAFMNDNKLLPKDVSEKIEHSEDSSINETRTARIIGDYIAGMTDRYAIAEHERIFSPAKLT